jgi:hypothetical protein
VPIYRKVYHRVRLALLRAILSDSVGPFVWLYYIPLWVWSIVNTILFLPTYIQPVMGETVYIAWNALMISGTSLVMCGLIFEKRINQGKRAHLTSLGDVLGYLGIHQQAAGHMCMFFVLLAYELAGIQLVHWGEPANFSIIVICPYVIGCLLLAVQALTKLVATEAFREQVK